MSVLYGDDSRHLTCGIGIYTEESAAPCAFVISVTMCSITSDRLTR